MLDILRSLKSLVKVTRTHIDNEVFRLHYTFTVLVLLSFCIVVTTKQYVGDPIDCIHGPDIPSNIINTYCWIHTTYTIPSAYFKKSRSKYCIIHNSTQRSKRLYFFSNFNF
ncbi:UNVERIFIED_CONTAM: shakB [Trichonephila clavipes]